MLRRALNTSLLTSHPNAQQSRSLAMLSQTRAQAAAPSAAATATRRLTTVKRLVTASGYIEPDRPAGNSTEIDFEEHGGNRVFTLNRPKALNALTWDMFYTMMKKADEWREDPNVKLVIGMGAGERAFAAGGDIKFVVEHALAGDNMNAITMLADSFRLHWKLGHLGKPYVSIIDGITMGGGAGLAFTADVRIATPRTVYASPEVRIGFSPEFGGSYFLSQLDGNIGTWLAITSRDVFGREAFELGIASHYVADESVPEIKARLTALEDPTADKCSAIVAEYHLPASEGLTSKKNPSGRTTIVGDIRRFLDATFGLGSLKEIHDRLVEAETDPSLTKEVQAWAKEQRELMDTRGPTGMAVAVENYIQAKKNKRQASTVENDILFSTGFIGANRATEDLMVGTVHSLFEKKKTPIPFSPSIKELDHPSLQPDQIRANFFDRNSPHLWDCPPMEYGNGLIPPPKSIDKPDKNWGRWRRFGLPSEERVRQIIDDARGKITDAELVSRVIGDETSPARRAEFEAAIRRILAYRTHEENTIMWNN